MQYLYLILALLCGTVFPIQAAMNRKMTEIVGHPILASFISILVGFISIFLYTVIRAIPLSPILASKNAPWYLWLAGALGAFYVSTVIILVPRLGLTLTFGLVIAGQLIISLLFDHYGAFGTPVKEISWGRIIGIILLGVGVLCIRKY